MEMPGNFRDIERMYLMFEGRNINYFEFICIKSYMIILQWTKQLHNLPFSIASSFAFEQGVKNIIKLKSC